MRIELTRRADYAVRASLALARDGDRRTGASIAAEAEIPVSFVPQVMGDLVRAGIVERRLGRSGGYRLRLAAEEVSLLDIIEAVEGDARRRTCVLRGGPCGRDGHCQVHDAFSSAQEALLSSLAGARLSNLALRDEGNLPPP